MNNPLTLTEASPGKKIHVVIVEPDLFVACTLEDILNAEGFAAKAFTDPMQGLRAILTEKPKVVISAVVMPEMNGIELRMRAKHECPDCKILLWSATPDAAEIAAGHSVEILPKPTQPDVLIAKIREVAGSHPGPLPCAFS